MSKKDLKDAKFYVSVNYDDDSEFGFDVIMSGPDYKVKANLMMVTRGVLMASNASTAYCYNDEGFEVCAYRRS